MTKDEYLNAISAAFEYTPDNAMHGSDEVGTEQQNAAANVEHTKESWIQYFERMAYLNYYWEKDEKKRRDRAAKTGVTLDENKKVIFRDKPYF